MKHRFLFMLMLFLQAAWQSSFAVTFIGDLWYNLDEETKTAEVVPSAYFGDLVIPQTVEYNGVTYAVTSIGEQAFFYSSLSSVTIPEGIRTIGNKAFYDNSQLTGTIDFPASLTSIGSEAFLWL